SGALGVGHIAHWDGVRWSPLAEGLNGPVAAIAVKDNGEVYAAGQFSSAGVIDGANNIAKWNGSAWTVLSSGLNGAARALAVAAGELYVGGSFTRAGGTPVRNVAKWNEGLRAWAPLLKEEDTGVDGNVLAIGISRAEIFLGGIFSTGSATNLVRLPRSGWTILGHGVGGPVHAITCVGTEVFAGGV